MFVQRPSQCGENQPAILIKLNGSRVVSMTIVAGRRRQGLGGAISST
jgi:hypothetical protein